MDSAWTPRGGYGNRHHLVVTEVDTSVGDVHEATARAVWRALRVEDPVPYVGFSDSGMVASWLRTSVVEVFGTHRVRVDRVVSWDHRKLRR